MDLGIRGRTAAVAAASTGLGFGCAAALRAEGVRVAICSRDRERVEAAAARLGADVVPIVADVSTEEGAAGFVDRAAAALGPIDILVANAGGPPRGTFSTTSLEAYREALALNALSTIAMCQRAVPAMRERRWGRVVAITSAGARQPIPVLAASSTARAAVTSFLKVLATEVAPDGVTVNSVQPGVHATDRIKALGPIEQIAKRVPAGIVGTAEDFGRIVAFLCSDAAKFVTGTSVLVDGGAYPGLI
ncbi:MAG TPA: SDR family oxidoreductase [Thermoanaerobaculia bacterium]|nr:SDR family oxidoreductase [Thermoanaerobaculia bacterium]